jgi:sugar O-acyltransferase (sialic acid O-acetyltransferase NeuD family)
MRKYYVIWGCSGHAKVLLDLIQSQGNEVVAFFDNKEVPSLIATVPLYVGVDGFKLWLNNQHRPLSMSGLVAIGGNGGCDRLKIQNVFRSAGIDLNVLIHPNAVVSASAKIGAGSQILANAVVGAGTEIGEACIINHNATVDHECVLGAGVHVAPGATVCGLVEIGENVMIGAGATVLPRLKIGHNSIVGAGSIVTKNVPSESVVLGNPARLQNNLI